MTRRRTARARAGKKEIVTLTEVLGSDVAASRLGVSRKILEQWIRSGPTKEGRQTAARIVITKDERMSYEAKKSYKIARKGNRLQPPRDAPGYGRTGKRETIQYRGLTSNVRMAVEMTDRTSDIIVHRIMTQAKKITKKKRKGRLFATVGMVEFGIVTGTPTGKPLRSIRRGPMGGMSAYQTFQSTDPNYGAPRLHGATDLKAFEVQVRRMIDQIVDHPKSAAVLDSFTVKRYDQKTKEEVKAGWVRDRRRRRR